MRKRFMTALSLCLVMVMAVLAIGVSCAEPEEPAAPAAPTTPDEPTTPAAPAEDVIEIVGETGNPPMGTPSVMLDELAARVEEASGGRVKFTVYYSSSLYAPGETMKAILSGVGDIHCGYNTIEDPGIFPMTRYFTVPFLGLTDGEQATALHRELLATYPQMTEEFQGLKLLYPLIYGGAQNINTTKKQIVTGADLEGLKLMGVGLDAEWMEAMGATPVSVSFQDIYTSLEKGVMGGDTIPLGITMAIGTLDLYKYHAMLDGLMSGGYVCCIMNPDTWNGLPEDIKKIFNDQDDWMVQRWIELEASTTATGLSIAEESGHTFTNISPEEHQKWIDSAKPIHEQWIADLESKGLPGQEFYDKIQEIIARS